MEIYNGIVTEKENNSILIFTLGGTSGGYSLKTNNKYLTASTAKSLSLSNTESKMWTISSTSDGYTEAPLCCISRQPLTCGMMPV